LQIVETFLCADLVYDDAEEQLQLFGQRFMQTVGIGQEATVALIEEVEESCQLLS
jgi:hypothetical protein